MPTDHGQRNARMYYLRCIDGETFAAIAKRWRITPNTVRQIVAKERERRIMEGKRLR
jgi:Mor family transcriptional regulator